MLTVFLEIRSSYFSHRSDDRVERFSLGEIGGDGGRLCRFGCNIRCRVCDCAIDGTTGCYYYSRNKDRGYVCRACRDSQRSDSEDAIYAKDKKDGEDIIKTECCDYPGCLSRHVPYIFEGVEPFSIPFIHPPLDIVRIYDPTNPRLYATGKN